MAPGGQRHHVQTVAIREGRLRPSLRIATRQGARRKALALASLTIEQSEDERFPAVQRSCLRHLELLRWEPSASAEGAGLQSSGTSMERNRGFSHGHSKPSAEARDTVGIIVEETLKRSSPHQDAQALGLSKSFAVAHALAAPYPPANTHISTKRFRVSSV